jgi:hypothetical protein
MSQAGNEDSAEPTVPECGTITIHVTGDAETVAVGIPGVGTTTVPVGRASEESRQRSGSACAAGA